jgi:hypothetical protein
VPTHHQAQFQTIGATVDFTEALHTHLYHGTWIARAERFRSKRNVRAIPLDLLEKLVGRDPTIREPPRPTRERRQRLEHF